MRQVVGTIHMLLTPFMRSYESKHQKVTISSLIQHSLEERIRLQAVLELQ